MIYLNFDEAFMDTIIDRNGMYFRIQNTDKSELETLKMNQNTL